ncbi:hypothetical protein BCR41DRAFT_80413 [Lobosporangium transversale]|uniref:ubiquitinyl hydrolase 1 n=1 Tax=Lobosporangium transversale TaxID=64571 RepID=A0A1Y2GM13_9FUNG|nr:hypothetical protein BCR41DRAFT_80413 [Lobosporangium transversale]ORZ14952.1 hypothetical protein BCR41DRAFT_80413 [Lobosporangium transversale]|eukprot:XP_021881084.1 hypothetical protein BCR41DRAFT_80413 [Lobosporangium transversale]
MPMSFPRSLQGARGFASSEAPVDGICGLSNLGNTCFMNSALQCLSNTPDLTRYILAGAWRDELNRDNPLGMGGEVARAYANLIDKLWKGTNKVFSPREFKSTIGRFAPSFTGYHQHDSQELLAFLLDGLHEDLNRIIKKPYTEVPDFSGRPDEEVAADCWKLHKARNDSIIVDLFQGQYKSTLVCPECHKISVTFDPFMYLSLPLPISKKWVGTVTYVPYDPKQPIVDIRLQLPKGSTQRVLKERVAELMNTQASHLYSAEVFANRFYKTHENGDVVDELSDTDKTFLYELPVPDFTNAQDHVVFPVLSMMEPTSSFGRISTFGHPMMVCVTKEEALDPDAVYKAILKQYSRYTTMDLYEDDTAESGERTKTDEQSADVDMTTPDDTKEERMAKSGLFRLLAFPPPPSQPSRYQYRPMTKPTMYAPSVPPSMNDMIDMYQRVLSKESGTSKEMDIFKSRHGQSWGDDNEDDSMNRIGRLGSPSGLSNSSRSSSRPRVPQPDQDELSEDEGEQSILQSRRPNFATASPSIPVCEPEPAVRKGEMVYCVWARPYESSIYAPERRYRSYRSMEEEETQESGVRVLWEQRGPPVVDPVLQEEIAANKKGRKVITLEDCLNEYTKEEQLGQEDLWYCPNCKKHQQATKKLDIWRFPDILVVHLKRFSHTRAWRDKIDAMVDFPIEGLDLSTKTLKENNREDNIYDLFGVSNHMGGLGGGHYTAYAKNEKLNQWYSFDDSHVSPVNKEAIKTSSAYLLFYRRRSAVLPEYEQRPASPVAEPSVQSISATPYYNYSVYSGPSDAPSSSLWRSELEEGQYGPWGKPPSETYDEYGPMPPAFFDDTDLPEYNSTIGASGMASPPSPFSEGLTFVSDKRNGKSRSRNDDNDADDEDSTMAVSYLDDPTAHSPDLSTCASDGSNPGTATVSPGFSPLAHATTIGEYPPRMQLPPHITLEDGRIDDSDEGAELPMRLYENIGTVGASIPTPSSTTIEGTEEAAGEEEESEQDGVQMVEWRKGSSDH